MRSSPPSTDNRAAAAIGGAGTVKCAALFGQQLIEALAGVDEDRIGPDDLLGGAGRGDLFDGRDQAGD